MRSGCLKPSSHWGGIRSCASTGKACFARKAGSTAGRFPVLCPRASKNHPTPALDTAGAVPDGLIGRGDTRLGAFLQRINAKIPGVALVLPTEAQWEHACRARTDTALYTGGIEILGERNAPALDAIA